MEFSFGFNKVERIYNKLDRCLRKMPIWFHLLILLALIFILVVI